MALELGLVSLAFVLGILIEELGNRTKWEEHGIFAFVFGLIWGLGSLFKSVFGGSLFGATAAATVNPFIAFAGSLVLGLFGYLVGVGTSKLAQEL